MSLRNQKFKCQNMKQTCVQWSLWEGLLRAFNANEPGLVEIGNYLSMGIAGWRSQRKEQKPRGLFRAAFLWRPAALQFDGETRRIFYFFQAYSRPDRNNSRNLQ